MEILKGIPVSPGVYIGEAFLSEGEDVRIPMRTVAPEAVAAEVKRFEDACLKVSSDLDTLRGVTESQLGSNIAGILSVQTQLLRDPSLRQKINVRISEQKHTAEYAVAKTLRELAKLMGSSANQLIKERSSDIVDLEKRVLAELLGEHKEDLAHLKRPVALIAHDLGPSQTAALDRTKVKAFATDVGGRTSHTSILARALQIPAVVGLETISADITGGETIIIDGNRGIVILRPDERTLARYRKLQAEFEDFERKLIQDKDLPAVTRDGVEVRVMANIEFPEEVGDAIEKYSAAGVGLFRTEFLYLKSGVMPSEQDHYEAYRWTLQRLGGRPLVIRTFDLGADKIDPAYAISEHNPFLGLRSIRVSMKRPENFRLQVRAILRASALGKVRLLLPMISCVEELRWARGVVEEIKAELLESKTSFDERIEVGIMIEVPAAAMQIRTLARECDFLSIGTNDLIQYTLAVDRGNEHVAHLFTPSHPAILALVSMVVEAGREANVPVAMCGEMAGDPIYVPLLVGMGLTELSVTPKLVPEVKTIVRAAPLETFRALAGEAMKMVEVAEIADFLREKLDELLPPGSKFGGMG
ncbi:MAG: phosphoenolpyruvate--protein phosphotransferase [Planctomycetota bacterium]|nr:phosphoenolpyruvate--protein phosphotransferase [Planctomycetota bacterium]